MAASKNIDLKSVLSYSYRVKAFFLTIHILIYVFVSFTNPESIDYVYRLDGIPRHYFFLGHANTFSMFLMWTFFEYIYVHYEQITMKSIVVIFALDMCLNYFSDSSTNMILITVVLMIVVYKKIYPSKKLSAIRFFAKYGYALMAVFFCGITVAYQYLSGTVLNIYLKLNDLLTSRLIHGAYVYSNYGMTLFGKEINFPENDYWQGYWFNGIACDNAYIWYMVSFGTLFMIIISVMFLKNAKKFNDIEIIMTCAYVLYSVTENYVTNAVFCFPLIFLAQYAFKADENINRRFKITLT